MNINQMIELVKEDFSFLEKYGYHFESEEIYNENSPDDIWYELSLCDNLNDKIIRIGLYPQKICDINIITKKRVIGGRSFGINDYLDHGIKEATHYVPMYELDKNNLEQSLAVYAKQIENLFDGELNKVIKGDEWINVRSYDPREDY